MRKYLPVIPLVLLLCFVVGCQDKAAMAELEEFKAQAALEEEYKSLVIRHDEAWLKGDFETLREVLSPDYVWHLGGKTYNLEETFDFLKQQMAAFSQREFRTDDLFVKGNKIVARYAFIVTPSGDVDGYPATGSELEGHGIAIARVENGKFVELWEEFDNLGFMMQLGYELKPPEEKK
jgi:predicted ester cyclase